ncbi:FdhF/YdeP family oxidoreductase [Streptomyces sp. NBC_00582]|uniref:FdhF/YdeP family oxidoreductase n=1 Tax=Streptomyces sp. NBC_00582 TaxID=2975783 RepID=UPI001063A05D|nr:FdhF/YdeP family oxidoreductase [Streptomyces sp. NBC_00582]WUB64939.1 FdhF/YdeP family oxidoreductase [Streptomyces sp. NBC_00582]
MKSTGPRKSSVGVPSVTESARHSLTEMGPGRSLRTLRGLNQADGFDCPSCAWGDPAPEHRKSPELCENGVKAVAWEATRKRVGAEFFAEHSVADLRERDGHWLEAQGRLTRPMRLAPGATHYTPVSWEEALALVADRLRGLTDPDRAVFYTSGRTSNEAAFLYQLLARRLGTNNLPDCSNMCHESSGAALGETLGLGKGLIAYDDIADHADLIVVVGQNPATCHPRMLTALEQAKRRGARIIAANPLPEAGFGRFHNPRTPRGLLGPGTRLADRWLPVRVNGDLALFAGLNKALIAHEDARPGSALDHDFIDRHCEGFEAAAAAWRALDWRSLETMAGLSRRTIEDCAAEVLAADGIVVCWAMGLTQHRNAVATLREIVNFLLLRGNVGRPGAGPAPIRGHSNVQGDRTMGIWEKMPDAFLDRLRDEFGFEPPRAHGLDTVDAIRAMRDGGVDVFIGLGGNFAAATPDTEVTEAALARCSLTVHIATKLNRSHLCHGTEALLLPCLGRTERDVQARGEQFVTVEDTMAMVHASHGRLPPGSPHLRSEVAIIADLGRELFGDGDGDGGEARDGAGDGLGWRAMRDDYAVIRRHIEHVVPGFHAFEQRVRRPGGFMLPRPPRDSRTFPTPTGKARFTVNPPTAADVPPGHLLLTTVRSHDQFNTTVYGFDDRYRGIKGGRRVVLVNGDDLRDLGLYDGDLVDLVSVSPDGERRADGFRAVRYPTPRGCAAAYYPETNVLVALDSTAETSNTPVTKSVLIRVEPSGGGTRLTPRPA